MATSPLARAGSTRGYTETAGRSASVSFAKESSGLRLAGTRDSSTRPRSGTTPSNGDTMAGGIGSSRRMSMPQQRQASSMRSPSAMRGRTASAAARRGDDANDYDGVNEDEDDDDEVRVHNLTFDGVKEGAYMLCKRSDDLLGHRARQVFREKAASMRGENSIYYYLKDLMKKFGSEKIQKKGLTSWQIVLEQHEFRKLIASDAAFQSAVPEEHIDALFHRMVDEDHKVIRHLDFVEFCLFDHHQLRLLLFKFRKRLKKMQLSDNEITDTFRRLTSPGGTSVSLELLHAAIARELDVVLTTGELRYLLQLMDLDGDSQVKVNDFEVFVKDDRASFELAHPPVEHGVVDLKVSMSDVEEANLRREGFTQLYPALHDESSIKVYLWQKIAPREDGKSAITNIRYAATARDSELVSKGFTCLQQDFNRGGAFGKHKYIWMSYVPSQAQSGIEVIDVCLSSGEQDDSKDAKLWLPVHRGFKLLPGNLIEKNTRLGVFLWIRRRPVNAGDDLVDTAPAIGAHDSPQTRSKMWMHVDELEAYVRQMLRRNCPVEQDGSINFARLFDEFDQKKTRAIGKQAMLAGVESFGIKMKLKDFPLVWDRMNPNAKKSVDAATFAQFLEMTDSEIDEIANTLQRTMTTKSSQHQQMPNYRLIFQSYNSLGDGRLSRSDFQRLLAENQINFTNTELSRIIQRLDINKDGVVDYADFLRYVTGICDAAARRAQRVATAAEELKTWAMEKQNKKLAKDGLIDSTASWKLLRPKRGVLDVASIDRVLRERGIRFDADKLRLLRVIIAPATNGEINQVSYHTFVNHQPRKINSIVYDIKKIAGVAPESGAPDGVYDRLNTEGNGRLPLVTFVKEVNSLAAERSSGVGPFDLKDLVYVVQWTGADCGGDGTIVIDRFLAAIRENSERRNMKHEFVTNYDSPSFVEGVKLLRDEMRRCAKTPDGKFDYRVPFRLFDKDSSGQIVLSEFETAVRELGVDKYLVDQEIKSLMRRFDLNTSGGINYDEFLRFNVFESSSRNAAVYADAEPILHALTARERLTTATIGSFCSSMKRMFSIIDKDTHGVVSPSQFEQTLRDMGIAIARDEMDMLVAIFTSENGEISYCDFCDAMQRVCEQSQGDVDRMALVHEPVEVLDLLCGLFRAYRNVRRAYSEQGKQAADLHKAIGISSGEKQRSLLISCDELKEVLWACGIQHPFLREELESIQRCFHAPDEGFNASAFCNFMEHGPSMFFRDVENANAGILDGYVSRLQEGIQTYMATGGRDAEERLFRSFDEFDEDGSGTLSHEEFVHVLHKAGLRRFLSQEDEALLLQFLDANGDGVISYKEFVDFAKQGERRINDAANQQQDDDFVVITNPSPRSRTLEPTPPRSPRSPSPSPTAKSASPVRPTTGGPSRLADLVAKLNGKLRPAFPFEKYFHKYRLSSSESTVKGRVFEKIMDKFLARLIEHNVAYNMHEVDADSLTRAYETRSNDGSAVTYEAFLADLKFAVSRAAAAQGRSKIEGNDSDSSDEHNSEVSCSSDEGDSTNKRATRLGVRLNEAIRRDLKSKQDYEALRTKVRALLADVEKGKRDSKASEKRVFKTLAALGIRVRKKEAESLLAYLSGTSGGRTTHYDLKKLGMIINEQLGILLGDPKKSEPSPAPAPPVPGAAKKEPQKISAALADKIYQCFIAAAQQNISGRMLLEKFDTLKSGLVTVGELQTVLRLMGCVLSESEQNDVKSAFAGSTSGTINYHLMVRQLTRQLQPPQVGAAPSARKLQDHRPAPIQIAPLQPTPKTVDDHLPQKPPLVASTLPPPRPLTSEYLKRLDGVLRPYFQELLATRRVDTPSLLRAFEPYDSKGTGFVSADAVHSVLRRFDIWLSEDTAKTVFSRYTATASGRFDYVEFSTNLGSGSASFARGEAETRNTTKTEDVRTARATCDDSTVDTSVASRVSKLPDLEGFPAARLIESLPRSALAASNRVTVGWSCPVCLHTQTRATSTTCEICAAQNPASVQYETLLKCSACEFRNRAGTTHCDLCRLPLMTGERSDDHRFDAAGPASPQKAEMNKPTSLKIQIPSAPTTITHYDEGWLA